MKAMDTIRFTAIIPARYSSSRFPGKPLALIGGKPMVMRVYEQALKAVENVFVATDDERIADLVRSFGGNVVMTSADHPSGTDRCAEAVRKTEELTGIYSDVVLNIQGDEPFIRPEQINLLKSCFSDGEADIATLIRKLESGEDINNPNQPKVITDLKGNAIYFSRTTIPFIRDAEPGSWSTRHAYYKHIGIYAYRRKVLDQITRLPQSSLEKAEALEQLRWIENGFKIRTAITDWESIGIDTPEDLERARAFLNDFI
jgi:3-deoxy-manno-octulosonate cytidylyltransferase (CMP-KDO synthetase)